MGVLPQLVSALIILTLSLSARGQNATTTQEPGDECLRSPSCASMLESIIACAVLPAAYDPRIFNVPFSGYPDAELQCLCKITWFLPSVDECPCYQMGNFPGRDGWYSESAPKGFLKRAMIGIVVSVVLVIITGGVSYALYRRSKRKRRDKAIELPIYGQGAKTELEGVSVVRAWSQPATVGELDGCEKRAELSAG